MTGPLEGSRISPEAKAQYKHELEEGVKLFRESLAEYEKSTYEPQKLKFKDVMDKALDVMNQAAKGCLNAKGQEREVVVEKDYQAFLNNDTLETRQQLSKDLDGLEDFLG